MWRYSEHIYIYNIYRYTGTRIDGLPVVEVLLVSILNGLQQKGPDTNY